MAYTHRHYPDISNTREVILEHFKGSPVVQNYKGPWVISEKIHGMNFQVGYDGTGFYYGSRNQLIQEPTIGQQSMSCYIREAIPNIWKELHATEALTVFGEYFGGCWPDQPTIGERVQRGVYYTPHNAIAVFDIVVDGKYLPFEELYKICSKYDLLMPPTLATVPSFLDAITYPNNLPSRMWKVLANNTKFQFTIPKEKQTVPDTNIMEGIVIRPLEEDLWVGDTRVIIKSKNDKFKETAHEQKVKEIQELPEKISRYNTIIEGYVTENRLDNVLSHFGTNVDFTQFGQVMQAYVADVFKDFELENPESVTDLDKSEKKILSKNVSRKASVLIRNKLLK